MRTQQNSPRSQPRLCTPSPLLNKGIFHSHHYHLWNLIFHKLCETDFVPFTLKELLTHSPNPPEFAHSSKETSKSWETLLFSQLTTAATECVLLPSVTQHLGEKNCSGGSVKTGHTAVYRKERDQILTTGKLKHRTHILNGKNNRWWKSCEHKIKEKGILLGMHRAGVQHRKSSGTMSKGALIDWVIPLPLGGRPTCLVLIFGYVFTSLKLKVCK